MVKNVTPGGRGRLAGRLRECARSSDQKAAFESALSAPDSSLVEAFRTAVGWAPPAELLEWTAVRSAFSRLSRSFCADWRLKFDLGWIREPERRVEEPTFFTHRRRLILLLTGLESFGRRESGDTCWVSTLPSEAELCSVHVYDGARDKLAGPHLESIGDFITRYFSSDATEDVHARLYEDSVLRTSSGRESGPDHENPIRLFERSRWLIEGLTGELPPAFAEQLSHAPPFEQWELERALIPSVPALANYWMLAHALLGNTAACDEALMLATRTPGVATAALADRVRRFLAADEGSGAFGALAGDRRARLLAAIRRNRLSEQLAPELAAALAKSHPDVVRLSRAEEERRLAAGETPWELIRAFPDDSVAHDRLLALAARSDPDVENLVVAYTRAREGDELDEWPDPAAPPGFPQEFSLVVSAAFREGLRLDPDHPRSSSGLIHTLLHFDDDPCVAAWEHAIDGLAVSDRRLGAVLSTLRRSRHPRATALLMSAANRFFDEQDAEAEVNHLLGAVVYVLRAGVDGADAIAARAMSLTERRELFGVALGLAFRRASTRSRREHLPQIAEYLEAADRQLGAKGIDDRTQFNLAEASAAFAELAPDEARNLLFRLFTRERESAAATLDVRGCTLAGLLPFDAEDGRLLAWVERILGDRSGEMRVYGALRGVERARLVVAASWVRPHLTLERISWIPDETGSWVVQGAARAALASLRVAAPEGDDSDKHALRVPLEDLPRALLLPHRYRTDSVLKRIGKEGLRDPATLDLVGAVVEDRLRYSADYSERAQRGAGEVGLKVLLGQGEVATGTLARLLELPYLAVPRRSDLLLCLRVVGDETKVREWVHGASCDELFEQLVAPEPHLVAWLDLVAASAARRHGPEALDPIRRAFRARIARSLPPVYGGSNDCEPTFNLLPRILAALGLEGRAELERARREHPGVYGLKEAVDLALDQQAPPAPPSFDLARPARVELQLRRGSSPTLAACFTVERATVSWESTFQGIGGFPGLPNELTARGQLRFRSSDTAIAWAREQIHETVLRGYRGLRTE